MKNNIFFATSKGTSEWITSREVGRFMKYTIWLMRAQNYSQDVCKLRDNIQELIRANGFNFTFLYLKECLRLVVRFLAGSPETVYTNGVRVRVNRHGLPVIIPYGLRILLGTSTTEALVTRLVLTCLSIFRTFPTKVKPSLDSIIEPFNGLVRTFACKGVVKRFAGHSKIGFGKISGFISESAGPISKRATWGSGVDAIALLLFPQVAFSIVRVLVAQKAYLYLASLASIWFLVGPIYLVSYVIGIQPRNPIGRLSVVYDQAGKARIVAITNWWIQLCLKPLHDSIFRFLETIPQDGTFNQTAPLDILLKVNSPDKFSCFDLTAATDRLPVDLQITILNNLGVDGNLWRNLLNIPWSFQGKDVYYSIGQPMGAYSSWAMLALTHHLIVKLAAHKGKVENFVDYAVLGDDIVIKNDIVAGKYLELMELLGVKINPSKSIISNDLCEFAKRLVTPTHDISPIGPGAILSITRKPALIGAFFHELTSKSLVVSSETVRDLLQTLPINNSEALYTALWTCFGVKGLLNGSAQQLEAKALSWITYGRSIDPFLFQYALHNGIRTAVIERARRAILSAENSEHNFYVNAWRTSATRGLYQGVYESLALLVSPGFWIYLESLIRQTVRSKEFENELHQVSASHAGTHTLLEMSPIVGLDLRWDKEAGKELNAFIRDATREIWRTYDEMRIIHGADGPNIY
jgi:hypothetical protein